jgi:3-phosphoshikimate 1-carboxyvinyltransferase
MKATIYPTPLSGDIPAIASKSQAHRLLICAALADKPTAIVCPTLSADITATADCLRALGADITYTDGVFAVTPIGETPKTATIDCGESGSTLRFLLPVVCALGVETTIVLHGRLPERPLSPLWEELERHGAVLSRPTEDTISVSGALTGGDYTLAANVSSQFISGLLFALPRLGTESHIHLTGTLESGAYLDMTVGALARFGVKAPLQDMVYTLPAGQRYVSPGTVSVEGDWSNGAFWVVADRILGGTLNITGLDPHSPQGDRAVEPISLRIAAGSAVVDCREIPDLVPVLSVLAAVSPGQTRFINAQRLRIKESDRLKTTSSLLKNLGATVEELPDGLVVTGKAHLHGGTVDSANDHRIAMSAAIAALACDEPVIVLGAQAVNKSYPAFWTDYQRLGGRVVLEDDL